MTNFSQTQEEMLKKGNKAANQTSKLILPNLPFSSDSLEPFISSETLSFHHGKHHAAYVNNANAIIADGDLNKLSLEELIVTSSSDATKTGLFNNVAQIWNHSFYWHCMRSGGGGEPTGRLKEQLYKDFVFLMIR